MNKDEIKRNAPQGATHYRPDWSGDPVYYMYKSNSMFLWMDEDCWQPSKLTIKNALLKPL